MKLNKFIQVALVLAIVVSGCGLVKNQPQELMSQNQTRSQTDEHAQIEDRARKTLQIGEQTLEVEVVNTPASLSQGLSGRDEIGADGMLFILPREVVPTFWMKEMKFDLDMVWIRDGQVVDITKNVPAPDPGTSLQDLPTFSPDQPADMVLEIPAGQANQRSIGVGELVKML